MLYKKTSEEAMTDLGTQIEGLTQKEWKERLEKNGFNELEGKAKTPTWKLFVDSFKDPLVIILLIAALVQIFLGEVVESGVIFAVLILNSILGVVQTRKAEGSLESLKQLSVPNAKVIREGSKITVPSRELVVGDIVIL